MGELRGCSVTDVTSRRTDGLADVEIRTYGAGFTPVLGEEKIKRAGVNPAPTSPWASAELISERSLRHQPRGHKEEKELPFNFFVAWRLSGLIFRVQRALSV
jgi:hypothetical protein